MTTQPMAFPNGATNVTIITTGAAAETAITGAGQQVPALLHNRSVTDGEDIYFDLGATGMADATSSSKSIAPGAYLPITLLKGQTHINTLAASGTPVLEIAVGLLGS